jgi:UDP-4-amino-4-deoxy-L-arabinose-oxoglutarate aminotransferase
MKVMESEMICQGQVTKKFELGVGEFLGSIPGVATSSGTAALTLALNSLDLPDEAEVILPTYVCRGVLEAVLTSNATPVLCDVSSNGVMTPTTVEALINPKTALIIAVHIFGHPVDVPGLMEFGVPILEDACQSIGLEIGGRMAGTIADIAILSFHATKCLSTGEGGMIICKDPVLLSKIRQLRDGTNSVGKHYSVPLSDLQSSLGLSQLARYKKFLQRRQELALMYTDAFETFEDLQLPDQENSFLFRYTVQSSLTFDEVQRHMNDQGIQVRNGVDALLHRMVGLPDSTYPVSCDLLEHTISLPFYPALSDSDATRVIKGFTGLLI